MKTLALLAVLTAAMGAKLTLHRKSAPAPSERPSSQAPVAPMPARTAEGWLAAPFAGR
jgi:hypothetical protein